MSKVDRHVIVFGRRRFRVGKESTCNGLSLGKGVFGKFRESVVAKEEWRLGESVEGQQANSDAQLEEEYLENANKELIELSDDTAPESIDTNTGEVTEPEENTQEEQVESEEPPPTSDEEQPSFMQ